MLTIILAMWLLLFVVAAAAATDDDDDDDDDDSDDDDDYDDDDATIRTCIILYIMITRQYNLYPLASHFYIVKLGFTGVYILS